MSAAAVFTNNLRFRFVEKSAYDVGDGTAWPMLATLAQIAELMYRVKDAWWYGGALGWKVLGSPATFEAPSSVPPANRVVDLANTTVEEIQRRGFCIEGSDDYNDATYDAGDGVYFSDISDNERGIWRTQWIDGIDYSGYTHPLITAFSFYSDSLSQTDSDWWGANDVGGRVIVRFNGEVAVVKSDPSDSMVAPTNLYYIGVEFAWEAYAEPSFGGTTDLLTSVFWGAFGPSYAVVCNYIIRLNTGDLTCPIYMGTSGATDIGYGASDIIHEAQVWWPYAKWDGMAPTAIWNSGTGAKL